MLLRRPSLTLSSGPKFPSLSPITEGKFVINALLPEGTVTHRNLAFCSPVSVQPLSQSIGFKGSITLEYLLTANGGGAGLQSIQTVKSNVNLVWLGSNQCKRYGY